MSDITPNVNEPSFDLSSLNLQNLPNSFPASEKAENQDGEKFVVFFLDDERFAVPADCVAEIVRPLDFTPLPNSPFWLHGIANLRGEIISVLNLSKICEKPNLPASSKSKVIVLKPKPHATPLALPVDRLSELVTFSVTDIEAFEDARFFGTVLHENFPVKLLDTDKLFHALV